MTKIIPVILSGGSGTRLWPMSRALNPKQFLNFFGEKSLFQDSVLRVAASANFAAPLIICNNEHRFIAAQNLAQIDVKAKEIILEPVGRNTAPAIAIAAFAALKKSSDAVILVMPSDHIVQDEKAFLQVVAGAKNLARENYLITFGITPDCAETGYGYIKSSTKIDKNSFLVEKFVEKPNKETAQKFLADGGYYWNAGIFMFKAEVYLQALKKLHTEIYDACEAAYLKAVKDLDFTRLDEKSFASAPNISADYAVMEKLAGGKNLAVMPLNAGWSDVGNWESISKNTAKDANENSFTGDVVALNNKNCYINSQSGIVAAVGLQDIIIINLKDALLVANKENAQDVKKIYEELKAKNRIECESQTKVLRPWGSFEVLEDASDFKVKKIIVKPNGSLSLQMHHKRAEHWIVVHGEALVTCGEKQFTLHKGESTFISLGQKHRLENRGKIDLEIIEVQTGDYLGEDDIVRFEDIYGR